MSTDLVKYQWEVRRRNTARLTAAYQQKNGTPIPLTGCAATLNVYDGLVSVLEKDCDILAEQITLFLTEAEIAAFVFQQGDYELIVEFPNGDKDTFMEGPIVVRDGRGPFE
jgi:hypothetical protein